MEPRGIPTIRDGGHRSHAVLTLRSLIAARGGDPPGDAEWVLEIRAGRTARLRRGWGHPGIMRDWLQRLRHSTDLPVAFWPDWPPRTGRPVIVLEWPHTEWDAPVAGGLVQALSGTAAPRVPVDAVRPSAIAPPQASSPRATGPPAATVTYSRAGDLGPRRSPLVAPPSLSTGHRVGWG